MENPSAGSGLNGYKLCLVYSKPPLSSFFSLISNRRRTTILIGPTPYLLLDHSEMSRKKHCCL